MISAILHLILALIALTGGQAVFYLWKKQKFGKETFIKNFIGLFACLALYHLSLAFSYFLSSGNLFFMAWGYIIAITFLILLVFFTFKIQSYFSGYSARLSLVCETCALSVAALVFFIQVYDFRLPIILPSNFIVWNGSVLASIITAIVILTASLNFIAMLVKNLNKADIFTEKLKIYLLISGILFMNLSLTYFFANTFSLVVLSFILHLLGIMLFSAAFLARRRIRVKI